MIFGKLLGGFFGLSWFGLPGAVIGLLIGHQFDKALTRNISGAGNQAQIQQAFLRMTFLTMGKLAKADGQVSKDEIEWAEFVMSRMNLTADLRRQAMQLFSEGKAEGFDLDSELIAFRRVVGRHATVVQMFLEIHYIKIISFYLLFQAKLSLLLKLQIDPQCIFLNLN